MDEQFLLRFVGLVALFAAVSILTVASLTLTQNISNTVFKPTNDDLPEPGENRSPYHYSKGNAGELRAMIHNYSAKLFQMYAVLSCIIALPLFFPVIADSLGGYQSDDGYIWFGAGVVADTLNAVTKYYAVACLGFVVLYAVYIVKQVARFKGNLLVVIDS